MKKLIFILIAIVISVAAYAQKPAVKPMPWNPYLRVMPQPDSVIQKPINPNHTNPKTNQAVLVGVSGNLHNNFVSYNSHQHLLSYNSDFNVLSYVHCGGSGFGNTNQVISSYSLDGGVTWSNSIIASTMSEPAGNYIPRFPSGALYNPVGNTDINNLYTVVAGPAVFSNYKNPLPPGGYETNEGTYIAWKKNDPSAVAKKFLIQHGDTYRADYNSFQICDNGKFYLNGYAHQSYSGVPSWVHTLVSGTLNATIDDVENVTTTSFTSANLPFYKPTVSSAGLADYSAAVAFNKSGTVGYYVFIGVRSDVPEPTYRSSYRPIVYKTTDGGTIWELQPDFDFDRLPAINEHIQGIWQDEFDIRPNFNQIEDLVVDGNDNLHILSFIYGQYTSNLDSLGYVWPYENIQGLMFDTYTSSRGWDAALIGTECAVPYDDASATSRLQGVVSSDGNVILYSWEDSDTAITSINVIPNIYFNGRCIDSANVTQPSIITTGITQMETSSNYHAMALQTQRDEDQFNVSFVTTQIDLYSDPVHFWHMKSTQDYSTYTLMPSLNILYQPLANQSIVVDTVASLSISIDTAGNAPAYQWQYFNGLTWNNVADGFPEGAQYINSATNHLKVEGISVVGTYEYRCFISLRKGLRTGYSDASTITVYERPNSINTVDPIITTAYPNPVADNLTIEMMGNPNEIGFVILNSLGQIIYRGNMLEKSTIETSNYTQGVYLIKFDNGKLFKFIKSEVK